MMEKNEQSIAEVMKDLYRKSYREAAKVIVAGGRDFTDYEFMRESLGNLLWMEDFCGDSDIKIISGMADGADTLAIRFADEFELTRILFCYPKFRIRAVSLYRRDETRNRAL